MSIYEGEKSRQSNGRGEKMKFRKFLCFSISCFLLAVFIAETKHTGPVQTEPSIQEEYVPNEVLVKFKKGTSRTLVQLGIYNVEGKIINYRKREIAIAEWDPEISSTLSFLDDPDLLHIRVPEQLGTEVAIYLLNQNPDVEYAEKNLIFHGHVK